MIHYTQFWDADIPSDPVVADCTAFYQLIGGVLPNAEDMRKRSHREHVGKSFSISAPPLKRAYPGHRQSPSRTPHESGGGTPAMFPAPHIERWAIAPPGRYCSLSRPRTAQDRCDPPAMFGTAVLPELCRLHQRGIRETPIPREPERCPCGTSAVRCLCP